ncbi:RusA family crossover junction endodeoxyribonuclease [Deinococcus hopiensis]|uniref:Holliday junction resolvase RusA (Prophage-encoded endonuclease) n=1 Tax=Deinococcus hopiensis KR-140 TaxID=695939 RepID=A0A1W1UV21_9DEIO|nr:RusA family crossover junction endodeoxyribonuclease [Deinococcus hopiensis]SMB84661.1 Holliday junction resolvase RusA (prophage-encoded endonuclease) [Deinococcus hopiensis KR-140]
MLSLWIPGEALSLNNAYFNRRGGGRTLTPEGRAFKAHVKHLVLQERPALPARGRLALTLQFHGHWETKAGEPRRRDLSNAVKLLEDALFDALGMDDCRVRALSVTATQSDTPGMFVRLETI